MKPAYLLPFSLLIAASAAAQTAPKTIDTAKPFNIAPWHYSLPPINRWSPIKITSTANKPSQCYALRSYQFQRDRTDPDATTLTSSSTCQLASNFQLKATQSR